MLPRSRLGVRPGAHRPPALALQVFKHCDHVRATALAVPGAVAAPFALAARAARDQGHGVALAAGAAGDLEGLAAGPGAGGSCSVRIWRFGFALPSCVTISVSFATTILPHFGHIVKHEFPFW
jgi:hypothetical protein